MFKPYLPHRENIIRKIPFTHIVTKFHRPEIIYFLSNMSLFSCGAKHRLSAEHAQICNFRSFL